MNQKLNFYDALRAVASGARITRLDWNNPGVYGFLFNGQLSLVKSDRKVYQWIVNDGDMLAEDWVLLDDYRH